MKPLLNELVASLKFADLMDTWASQPLGPFLFLAHIGRQPGGTSFNSEDPEAHKSLEL